MLSLLGKPTSHFSLEEKSKFHFALKYLVAIQNEGLARISPSEGKHLEEVGGLLGEWHMPFRAFSALIILALAHSGVDVPASLTDVFGWEAIHLANEVGKRARPLSDVEPEEIRRSRAHDRLSAMFRFAYTDVDVALLSLALHVIQMRNIAVLAPRSAHLLAEDSQRVFIPLTEMLGTWKIQRELGEPTIIYLNPPELARIDRARRVFEEMYSQDQDAVLDIMRHELKKAHIPHTIDAQVLQRSILYTRMVRGESLREITNRLHVFVVIEEDGEDNCYTILGRIHRHFQPSGRQSIAGRNFRDLIAAPKFNGYRALGTTVIYHPPSRQTQSKHLEIEFRIYTQDIKTSNHYGIIQARYRKPTAAPIKKAWWEDKDLTELVQSHEAGSISNPLYVFSPIGQVRKLKKDSTPIDYAYHIHSNVGDHCKLIWVNGRLSRYDRLLKNSDIIEVRTDPDYQPPLENWQKVVVTTHAKTGVASAISRRNRSQHPGKRSLHELLKKEFQIYRLPEMDETTIEEKFEQYARGLGLPDADALYSAVADRENYKGPRIPEVSHIVSRIIATQFVEEIALLDGTALGLPINKIILAEHEHGDDHDKKLCRVVPNTPIVGRFSYQKTGAIRKAIIYPKDCTDAPQKDAVELTWRPGRNTTTDVWLKVEAVDSPYLLQKILEPIYTLYPEGLRLSDVKASVDFRRKALIDISLHSPTLELIHSFSDRFNALQESGVVNGYKVVAVSALERSLLEGRRRSLYNPYHAGHAISDPRIFKGRETEIDSVIRYLREDRKHIVLYGTNRIGKSSLVEFISRHKAGEQDFRSVYVDVSADLDTYTEPALLYTMACRIEEMITGQESKDSHRNNQRLNAILRAKDATFDYFSDWLDEALVRQRSERLLITLDEFVVLDDRDPATNRRLWDVREAQRVVGHLLALPKIQQRVALIFCVQEAIYKSGDGEKFVVPHLLRGGHDVELGPLDASAARRLIREPMGEVFQYEDAAVSALLKITGCHPYYLQRLLGQLVHTLNPNIQQHVSSATINIDSLRAVIADFYNQRNSPRSSFSDYLKQVHGFHEMVLREFTTWTKAQFPKEQGKLQDAVASIFAVADQYMTLNDLHHSLEEMYNDVSRNDVWKSLEYLVSTGILKVVKEGTINRYFFQVPLFGKWLQDNWTLA